MKAFYSDDFTFPLPEGHRFPIRKYRMLRERVATEGLIPCQDLIIPDPASVEQLSWIHTPGYVQKVICGTLSQKEILRTGFPWSPGLVERSRRSVGGTIAACRVALEEGIAANLAGGTHHAHADYGEGFCVFNDIAVAARVMQAESLIHRAVILDCDVHQGDGTAAIFQGDDSVFTFSIHSQKNFPFHKEASDLDISLPDGTDDGAYLEALHRGVKQSLEQARADLVLYLAGADPYTDDRLGRLALTKAGLAERDRLVFEACLAAGLPVAITMAGGYARRVEDAVDIHFQTLQLAVNYQLLEETFDDRL